MSKHATVALSKAMNHHTELGTSSTEETIRIGKCWKIVKRNSAAAKLVGESERESSLCLTELFVLRLLGKWELSSLSYPPQVAVELIQLTTTDFSLLAHRLPDDGWGKSHDTLFSLHLRMMGIPYTQHIYLKMLKSKVLAAVLASLLLYAE